MSAIRVENESGLKLLASMQTLAANAWFAYGAVGLLQLKLFLNIWLYRDLTAGDTSYYFVYAYQWYSNLETNIAWSPLYNVFYGGLMHVWGDVYSVTLAHRVIIGIVASLLVLALLRRLLPSSIALLISAWWVILPVNYDMLYEVHLFALIPVLVVCLIAAIGSGRKMRGAVLGAWVITTALVRNEFLITTVIWLAYCVIYELWERRTHGAGRPKVYVSAYGIPLLIAALLIVLTYQLSTLKFPALSEELRTVKHGNNVCQIYTYNYQQRFDDWRGSPWLECDHLMQRVFGQSLPSMAQAIAANPQAMLDYFLWNLRLIPDGLQVLLFNATSGDGQPDYIPVSTGATYAGILGILLLGVVITGVVMLWRNRLYWWNAWLNARAWGWLALIATVPTAVVVMVMQRPRPEYLYSFSVFTMAVTGMCLVILARKTSTQKIINALTPFLLALLIVFVPLRYVESYHTPQSGLGRPLLRRYERLVPFRNVLDQPGLRLLAHGWGAELCHYLSLTDCTAVEISTYASLADDVAFADWLDSQEITVAYLDEYTLANAKVQEFVGSLDASVWETISQEGSGDQQWMLLGMRTINERTSYDRRYF